MKKFGILITAFVLAMATQAQTLNVVTGNVTYQFPAADTGDMTYTDGTTLTICGKAFTISDISKMYTDDTAVTPNQVAIAYNGTTATVTVAGNVAQYVTPTLSGAHVSILQSNTADVDGDEITYTLSGTSTDGEFYMSGTYKATIALNGLTLNNAIPVFSGAAIHIQDGKRIDISVKKDTENTLTDCASPSDDLAQKGCLYVKGHAEFKGKGTLSVKGRYKHAIKAGEYISVKNCTINVTGAVSDGFNCNEYFLVESGTLNVSGIGDDGIQSEIDEDATATAETTDHEDENSGNIYIADGTLTLANTANGGKCIKADGAFTITGGTITASATGSNIKSGNNTTAAKCIKADGAITITGGVLNATAKNHEAIESKSTLNISGGTVYAQSSDDAINAASHITIIGGTISAYSTGNDGIDANGNCYIKGGTIYAIGSRSPEVGIDANTEGGYKLYVSGGTLVAIGGLESGASLTQSCYQLSSSGSGGGGGGFGPGGGGGFGPGGGGGFGPGGEGSQAWTANTWYALYTNGTLALAFKTPASGGTSLVVSAPSTPTLQSGVTVTGGTTLWNGMGNIDATVTGGTAVELSTYSSGGSWR